MIKAASSLAACLITSSPESSGSFVVVAAEVFKPPIFVPIKVKAQSPAVRPAPIFIPAVWTGFSVVSVYLQKRRIAVVLSFGLQVILRCDTIFLYKIRQTFGNLRSKTLPFLWQWRVLLRCLAVRSARLLYARRFLPADCTGLSPNR